MISPLSLFFLALLCSICTYVRIKKAASPIEFKPFDLNASLSLRGILAILIVCHHIGQRFSTTPMCVFINWGTPLVALFFLISGYGLMVSYKKKGDAYLSHFLKHRYSQLLPDFLILTILCIGILIFFNHKTFSYILYELSKGNPPHPNSWFIYAIFILYLVFYWAAKSSHTYKQIIIKCALLTILIMGALYGLKFGSWWYYSMPSFVIGMILATYEGKILTLLKTRPFLTIFSLVGVLGFGAVCSKLIKSGLWAFPLTNILPIIILFTIYTFGMFSNKVTRYLGKISLEIYLVHGIFLRWFMPHTHLSWIPYILLALALTIPSADVMHRVNSKIASYFKS